MGDLVGGVGREDEAGLVGHHHGVPADGVDGVGREDLAAPAGEEAPLVQGQAHQASRLGAVDHVAHLSHVLAGADRHHREPADLGGVHEELHRLPLVAITPPPRRRRRSKRKATAARTRTTSTTISQPIASIALLPLLEGLQARSYA